MNTGEKNPNKPDPPKQTNKPKNKPQTNRKQTKTQQHTKTILCILLNSRDTLKFFFAKMKFKLRAKSNENKKWKSILKVKQVNKDHWRVLRIMLDSIKKALKLFCFCDWQLDFIWLRTIISLKNLLALQRGRRRITAFLIFLTYLNFFFLFLAWFRIHILKLSNFILGLRCNLSKPSVQRCSY